MLLIPGGTGKVTLVGTAIVAQAFLIYIVIYMNIIWSGGTKCTEVYQRPHEQHKIKLRPQQNVFPLDELEADDLQKLVNLTNFSYVNSYEIPCAISDVFLLVLVPSAPNNKEKRDTIRNTWGAPEPEIKVFFMIGISEDKDLEYQIEQESMHYEDIIQGNFIDSYHNMTYKAVMSLKYAIYHCPRASYILKVEDDSFVNMPLLKNFLKHDLSPYGAENLFLCNDMTGSPAIRDPTSKWYVPEEDFPHKFYPSYCSGWYAIFSPDVCFKLYREAQQLKYIFIDDAFVYGMAAKEANLKHIDMNYYTMANRRRDFLLNGTYDNVPLLFGAPNMSPSLIKEYYEYFNNKPVPHSVTSFYQKMN